MASVFKGDTKALIEESRSLKPSDLTYVLSKVLMFIERNGLGTLFETEAEDLLKKVRQSKLPTQKKLSTNAQIRRETVRRAFVTMPFFKSMVPYIIAEVYDPIRPRTTRDIILYSVVNFRADGFSCWENQSPLHLASQSGLRTVYVKLLTLAGYEQHRKVIDGLQEYVWRPSKVIQGESQYTIIERLMQELGEEL